MKDVIIYGGSRGIGKSMAVSFYKKGYNVTAVSRNIKKLIEMQRDFPDLNITAADVCSIEEVRFAFSGHKKRFGVIPFAVVVTAGIQGALGPVWELTQEEFESAIKANLIGSFNTAKVAVENMIEEKSGGSIIVFSGGGSCYARLYFSAYGVSKTGVLRLVENFSDELILKGHSNIIINAIAPGAVKTDMTEEILKSKELAGEKAYNEALEISRTGGTDPKEIFKLIEFLSIPEMNKGISGRLIHYKDNYMDFANNHNKNEFFEAGKLRRINIPE